MAANTMHESAPLLHGHAREDVVDSAKSQSLHRPLSPRQVSMTAISGAVGTGLFLSTGRSLATGGPASVLICYAVVGFIVYIVMLLLGEIATQYPSRIGDGLASVCWSLRGTGSFNAYANRFVDDAFGFALAWNYWFTGAVAVAADLTASQLVVEFWTSSHAWLVPVVFFLFILSANAFDVGAYGELEYWLSSLKILTIVLFILIGTFVNVGLNREQRFIGFSNWRVPGAPFVGGFGGFATVFVTASFAYGGTESLGITAGETANPSRNLPRVVRLVFFRILLFYVLSIFIIGLNVPWDYPGLADADITTSPFTIVFRDAGSTFAASFMNAVVLSSALSAANHKLFAGARVLHALARADQAPAPLAHTTARGVPLRALLATAGAVALALAPAYARRAGTLWHWLQNAVGASNQITWLCIGLASARFRAAWTRQGRPRAELKFQDARWTWGWGAPFVVGAVAFLALVQGWSSVVPRFRLVEFVSFYVQAPAMALCYAGWKVAQRTRLVDLDTVDLRADEHVETTEELLGDEARERRLKGPRRLAWGLYYALA